MLIEANEDGNKSQCVCVYGHNSFYQVKSFARTFDFILFFYCKTFFFIHTHGYNSYTHIHINIIHLCAYEISFAIRFYALLFATIYRHKMCALPRVYHLAMYTKPKCDANEKIKLFFDTLSLIPYIHTVLPYIPIFY